MKHRTLAMALALSAAAAVGACSKHDAKQAATAPAQEVKSDKTLADALAGTPDLSVVAQSIKDTGLGGVFDGRASYTLFAPADPAFTALGDAGTKLRQPEQRAALAAFLRAHIVPGVITPEDLAHALDRAGAKPVHLRTVGKQVLTVTRENGRTMVAAADGSKAVLMNETVKARNGSAIAIDGTLKKLG